MASRLSLNMFRRLTQRSFAQGSQCPDVQPGLLRIYSMRFCPFAHRTRLVLLAKKIPHETVNINLKSKPDWFLKKNPLGLVPVLELNGRIVYESVVCNDYLDEMYPDVKLNPSDPYKLANDKMLVEVSGKVVRLFYRYLKNPEEREKYRDEIISALRPLEEALPDRGTFFGGGKPMMADFNIWPWIEKLTLLFTWSEDFEEVFSARLPSLRAWIKDMLDVPEVKSTFVDHKWYMDFFAGLVNGSQDYDAGLSEADSKL